MNPYVRFDVMAGESCTDCRSLGIVASEDGGQTWSALSEDASKFADNFVSLAAAIEWLNGQAVER